MTSSLRVHGGLRTRQLWRCDLKYLKFTNPGRKLNPVQRLASNQRKSATVPQYDPIPLRIQIAPRQSSNSTNLLLVHKRSQIPGQVILLRYPPGELSQFWGQFHMCLWFGSSTMRLVRLGGGYAFPSWNAAPNTKITFLDAEWMPKVTQNPLTMKWIDESPNNDDGLPFFISPSPDNSPAQKSFTQGRE